MTGLPEISERLLAVAQCVDCTVTADVGTDHGYVPIYLCLTGKTTHAFGSDVRKGPLQKARENVEKYQLSDRITLRLGSGLAPYAPGEVPSVVMAGMGGMLMMRLMEESPAVVDALEEMVLSPQQDIPELRRFVHEKGFCIAEEKMLKEGGKYYHILHCKRGKERYEREMEYLFGKCLLDMREPLLKEFLLAEEKRLKTVLRRLTAGKSEKAQARAEEVNREMAYIKEALQCL